MTPTPAFTYDDVHGDPAADRDFDECLRCFEAGMRCIEVVDESELIRKQVQTATKALPNVMAAELAIAFEETYGEDLFPKVYDFEAAEITIGGIPIKGFDRLAFPLSVPTPVCEGSFTLDPFDWDS